MRASSFNGKPKATAWRSRDLPSDAVAYVSKDDPPVLTLHGDQDALVPVDQAKLLTTE